MAEVFELIWKIVQVFVSWFFVALFLGIINMYIDRSKIFKKERKFLIKILLISLVFTLFGYSYIWLGIVRIISE